MQEYQTQSSPSNVRVKIHKKCWGLWLLIQLTLTIIAIASILVRFHRIYYISASDFANLYLYFFQIAATSSFFVSIFFLQFFNCLDMKWWSIQGKNNPNKSWINRFLSLFPNLLLTCSYWLGWMDAMEAYCQLRLQSHGSLFIMTVMKISIAQTILETIPSLIIQGINNSDLQIWNTLNIISYTFSAIALLYCVINICSIKKKETQPQPQPVMTQSANYLQSGDKNMF